MTRTRFCLAAVAAFIFGSALLLNGQEKAKESGITIGEMRMQTIPAQTYLCVDAETNFKEMGDPVRAGFDKVFGAAAEAKMLLVKPTMLVYQGNPHLDPQKTFKMEIGVIVIDGTAAPEGLKVRKTDAFKCATILFTGPVAEQGQAWQKLIQAAKAAGLEPTGEEREVCLYWEGPLSGHNIFWMQLGIK